jgi:hypothetical protein
MVVNGVTSSTPSIASSHTEVKLNKKESLAFLEERRQAIINMPQEEFDERIKLTVIDIFLLMTAFDEQLKLIHKTPDRIVGNTKEAKITYSFSNKSERIYFEIYDDYTMGFISEDLEGTKIIRNQDLSSMDEMIAILKDF